MHHAVAPYLSLPVHLPSSWISTFALPSSPYHCLTHQRSPVKPKRISSSSIHLNFHPMSSLVISERFRLMHFLLCPCCHFSSIQVHAVLNVSNIKDSMYVNESFVRSPTIVLLPRRTVPSPIFYRFRLNIRGHIRRPFRCRSL